MICLRGRFGIGNTDKSKDEDILKMSPAEMVRECTIWELGDPSWANQIARWMKSAGCTVDDLINY